MVRPGLLLFLMIAVGWNLPARASWEQKYIGGADTSAMANSVSSPDGQHVYACGVNLQVSNPLTDPVHRLLESDDAGETWLDITSGAKGLGTGMIMPLQVQFIDTSTGWLNLGATIAHTSDGGKNWSLTTLAADANRFLFLDAQNGLVVGNGGAAWSSGNGGGSFAAASSPASVDLLGIFFVDRQHGYLCGNNKHTEGTDPDTHDVADHGQVVATGDGGQSFRVLWETDGQFLGRIFFQDVANGWICASDNTGTVYLLHSTDGGTTWNRQDVPTTVSGMMGHVKALVAVGFTDSSHGRAMGVFDTGFNTSDGGEIYMLADYVTSDAGGNWTLKVNSPGTFPNLTAEGAMLDALYYSEREAWAVGTGLRVYKDALPCSGAADCLPSYLCDAGKCKPNTSGPCNTDPDCFSGNVCRNGTCGPAGPGPCAQDSDCPSGETCQHSHCALPPGCDESKPVGQQGCPYGQVCAFGMCIQNKTCQTDTDCSSSMRCFQGHCYPKQLPDYRCLTDADCASSEQCLDTWCQAKPQPDGGGDGGPKPDGSGGDGGPQPDGAGDSRGGGGGCGCGVGAGSRSALPLLALALMTFVFWCKKSDLF